MNKAPEHSNALSKESSPYLLQHAQNPVDWKPWNDQTKEEAKKAGKPILFSIGYAACHWCHVMEHESFEDEEVAAYMNKHFTCVKVDREERPDVDALYMDAVQLITGQGGWPLHAFTFPDGQPFYGGTYFPKERWLNVLGRINQAYTNDYDDLKSYADKLAEGLKVMNVFEVPEGEPEFRREQLDVGVSRWSGLFDPKHGGHGKAPKFPMPDNYLFLLEYATVSGNQACLNQVNNTLTSMALSGLYDTVGGGFARYSTDERWHVPHFEKMLYDNAQLIRLYADAYRATGNKLYLKTAQDTYGFCHSELSTGSGFYFSSLDADTEGEEGKYYVWTTNELKDIWKENSDVLFDYFQIDKASFWEQGKNVLMPVNDDSSIREQYNLTPSELETLVSTGLNQLNAVRDERVKPGLDDKSLTSWNALMLTGLCALYKAEPKDDYLHEAEKIASFIWSVQRDSGNELFHSFKEDKSSIPGFLEDYCFAIEAFISLYEISFNEIYLNQANDLLIRCQAAFQDPNSGLFFMTPIKQQVAVTRKIEFMDNVIPSGNSTMALCLYKLGRLFDNPDYIKQAESMLHKMEVDLSKHITNYSSWGRLLLYMTMPKSEVVFTGERVKDNLEHFHSSYRPGTLAAGHQELSNLPLLKNRYVKGKSFMYVCVNSVCELPLENPEDIIGRLPSFG